MITSATEEQLLKAEERKLSVEGYDIFVNPNSTLLPDNLANFRVDAIAIGREPKLVVEVASEGPKSLERVRHLQQALSETQGWRLYLVHYRSEDTQVPLEYSDRQIRNTLEKASKVAEIDARAALLLCWAALEALSRSRRPSEFSRPQTPGRIIDRFAAQGIISQAEAKLLRSYRNIRNAIVHGDLGQRVSVKDVDKFIQLLRGLLTSEQLATPEHPEDESDPLWARIKDAGKFEIYVDKADEYRYRLKASSGEIILVSEGYRQRNSAENAISSVMKNASIPRRYERKDTKAGKKFFNLKAANGQVIGTSTAFSTSKEREKVIEQLLKFARLLKIQDLT